MLSALSYTKSGYRINCIFSSIESIASSTTSQNVVWNWMAPALSYIFRAFWVIPLFWLTKPLNNLWYQVTIEMFVLACVRLYLTSFKVYFNAATILHVYS